MNMQQHSKQTNVHSEDQLCVKNSARLADEYCERIPPYPNYYRGRGIVTCAGGPKYFTTAWVLIKMLRRLGCRLPIQVWYLGEKERDEKWISLVEPLGVECIDAYEVREKYPHPRLAGWECKPYAILHSQFKEVLFLDADNVPVHDPTYLFNDTRYVQTGSIFWPDWICTPQSSSRWRIFGVPYRDEREQESGQILINKRICWKALNLCNWYNQHSDFYYKYVYGDKDTFRFAWHRSGQPYLMPSKIMLRLHKTFCQHDLDGNRLFQHRCGAKWSLDHNLFVRGFMYQHECEHFTEELRQHWQPSPGRCISSP